MNHVLLATTGESPQVVTETLFALHAEGRQWPDEIFLITTTLGRERACQGLLDGGHLDRLCDEIGRPRPAFDPDHIRVIPDAHGTPVDDARSVADHEALADFIMAEVRRLTGFGSDAVTTASVHASLAGGRKTMTFYLGYAMSLFGRRQDMLSHVLVSKGFESHPRFWYPSANQQPLQGRDGQPLVPSHAEVTLAPIPFVRHRHFLPHDLPGGSSIRFRDLVRLINLSELPEELHVRVDLPARRIVVTDLHGSLRFEFTPGLIGLAFYAMMARATREQKTDVARPNRTLGHVRDLFDELLPLCGLPREEQGQEGDGDIGLTSLDDAFAALQDWNELAAQLDARTLATLRQGMTASWFDQRRTELRRLFEAQLPERLCRWLTPELIWTLEGTRLSTPGGVRGGGYGIALPAENIELVEAASS